MKRAKGQSNAIQEMDRENKIAERKLHELKKVLEAERNQTESNALRAESLSNFGADILSVAPNRPRGPSRALPKFPKEAYTTVVDDDMPSSARQPQPQRQKKTKKVRLTYLKDEPDEPVRKPAGTTLSDRLKEIQTGRYDNIPPPASTVATASCGVSTMTSSAMETGHQSQESSVCGQCEEVAGSKRCLDCKEIYCHSCFAHFHQKGALKSHTAEPLKTTINTTTVDSPSAIRHQSSQSAATAASGGRGGSLLVGTFDEEEQSRLFQEALAGARQIIRSGKASASTGSKVNSSTTTGSDSSGVQASTGGAGGAGGGALWGEYNEEKNAADFAKALQEWRDSKSTTTSQKSSKTVEQRTTATSSDDIIPAAAGARSAGAALDFGKGQLTYTERLMLQKYKEGKWLAESSTATTATVPDPVTDCDAGSERCGISPTGMGLQGAAAAAATIADLSELDEAAQSSESTLDLLDQLRNRPMSSYGRPPHEGKVVDGATTTDSTDGGRVPTRQHMPSMLDPMMEIGEVELRSPRIAWDAQIAATGSSAVVQHASAASPIGSQVWAAQPDYKPLYDFLVTNTEEITAPAEISIAGEGREPLPENEEFKLGMQSLWIPTDSVPGGAAEGDTVQPGDPVDVSDEAGMASRSVQPNIDDSSTPRLISATSAESPESEKIATCKTDQTSSDGADDLQFKDGDLRVIDLDDGVTFADSDEDEERCFTELARELATAHGWRESDTTERDSPVDADAVKKSLANLVDSMTHLEAQTRSNLEAEFEALRQDMDSDDDVRDKDNDIM